MNLGIYDVVIDFSKLFIHNTTNISFKDGDLNTAKVKASLTMENKPIDISGCNVAVKIETLTGVKITDSATIIDSQKGIIEIDFKSNSLVKGTNFFEIWIIKDSSVKKSGKIGYRVLDSIDDAGAIEGANEYPILISLISDANKAIQDAKEVLNIAKDMESNVNEAIGNTNVAISNAETATSNANTKIDEVETTKTEMIKKVDTSIDTMKLSVEDAKASMQATTDAKMQQVDNSIVDMKSDVETAKNEMASKADEKIADVDRALAAGTVDLELKEARKDASGVVHDTVKQRLDSDLIIGNKSLKDFVINMDGMKESQDLLYDTTKSYQVCTNTQVGVVKDLKVYGETMINNIVKVTDVRFTSNGTAYYSFPQGVPFVSGNIYTYIVFNVPSFITAMYLGNSSSSDLYISRTNSFEPKTFIAKESLQINDLLPHFYINEYREFTESEKVEIRKIKLMIVKGDYTKNPPSYFEGMASVANGTPLEVTTRNMAYDYTVELVKNVRKNFKLKKNFGEGDVIKNISDKSVIALVFDATTLAWVRDATLNKGDSYVVPKGNIVKTITIYPHNGWVLDNHIYLEQLISVNDILKLDKKPILYKDANGAWKPLTELKGTNDINRRDVIDTENNSYTKMVKEVIEKGEGSWQVADSSKADTVMFLRMFTESERCELLENNANICCDKFDSRYVYSADREGIFINRNMESSNGGVYIRIKASKLESRDVAGFKKWLQNNNTRYTYKGDIVYKYELNPIYPDSFEGDTLVMIPGGPLPIKASWKITSSLPNFVKELSNQIKQLQDQVYKTNVANFTVALNTLDTKLRLDRLEAPQM